jgi:hypothetical protein
MEKCGCDSEKLMNDIIFDKDAERIWGEILAGGNKSAAHPLYGIIEHQKKSYEAAKLDPADEGFQLPAPWFGNIGAKILFLGQNPGFTPTVYGPRLVSEDRFRTCGARHTAYPDISEQAVASCFTDYFQNRDITSVTANGGISVKTISASAKDGTTRVSRKYVPYWTGVRVFLEKFIGLSPSPGETTEVFTRRVMQNGVCVEIVPFAAASGTNLLTPALVDYCWENFSGRVLEQSEAGLIVLVGAPARNAFVEKTHSNKSDSGKQKITACLIHGGVLEITIGGKPRKCVALAHFSRWGIAESGILLNDFFSPANPSLSKLRACCVDGN